MEKRQSAIVNGSRVRQARTRGVPVNNDKKINELESVERPPEGEIESGEAANDEFQITIRKLELPVQPRGVLAE